jgi:hypothetical protein
MVDGGSITAEQALGVVLKELKAMDGIIESEEIPSKLMNPELVYSIQHRSNDAVIAKLQAFVERLPDDDDIVGDALNDLKRSEDETVLLVLATLRHLLTTPPASSDWSAAQDRHEDLLTRILYSLLPIIVVEDSKEALNFATMDLARLQRGNAPAGAVTKCIRLDVLGWIQGMCDNLSAYDVAEPEISCPLPDPELTEPADEEMFQVSTPLLLTGEIKPGPDGVQRAGN